MQVRLIDPSMRQKLSEHVCQWLVMNGLGKKTRSCHRRIWKCADELSSSQGIQFFGFSINPFDRDAFHMRTDVNRCRLNLDNRRSSVNWWLIATIIVISKVNQYLERKWARGQKKILGIRLRRQFTIFLERICSLGQVLLDYLNKMM